MTPTAFVAKCTAQGVRLSVLTPGSDGLPAEPIIRATFPRGVRPPARFVEVLRTHKPDIVRALLASPAAELEPPPFASFADLLHQAERNELPRVIIRLGPGATVADPNRFVQLCFDRAEAMKRRFDAEVLTDAETRRVRSSLRSIRRDLEIVQRSCIDERR